MWGFFARALVALAVVSQACLLEKELLIANGDEWLGDDTAELEVAVTDVFVAFFSFYFLFCSPPIF